MALPLIEFPQTSCNYRVEGYVVPGDDVPRLFCTDYLTGDADMSALIDAAYRQVYNQQHSTQSSRSSALESQLRNGQISVREFVRGLATSKHFRTQYYDTNNNYRFVQLCIQRILGRDVSGEREKLAWSTVLATKGIEGFIDDLLNTDEYFESFGSNTVPYQRRRTIAQRFTGELPFERMARYDANHLSQLQALGNDFSANRQGIFFAGASLPPKNIRYAGSLLTYAGGAVLLAGVSSIFLSMIGLLHI